MSITTVLPMDDDQWRTPVIFGKAASLSSATALRVSGSASEATFCGFIRLSETGGDRTSAAGAGGVVTDGGEIAVTAALGTAALPCPRMPHHAPAENNAATATSPITTFNPGRELPCRGGWCKKDKKRYGAIPFVDRSLSNDSSTTPCSANSAKYSGNSTVDAEMAIGSASALKSEPGSSNPA